MKDPVTGLNNRQQFLHILECDISDAATHQVSLALLLIDIRQFSRINMKYGYTAGDGVLRGVASALQQVRREGDHIARVGDDKFGLILAGVLNSGHAEMAAHKIKRLLDMPVLVGQENIR